MRHTAAVLGLAGLLLGTPAIAACPADAAVEALARSLLANQPAQPLAGMTSLEHGQCAQDKLVAVMVQHWGRPVGYKVGLTNAAAQQRFGVPHPVTGTIYESTVRLRSGAEVPARFGSVPTVEADMLVRISSDAINDARTHLVLMEETGLFMHLLVPRSCSVRGTPR